MAKEYSNDELAEWFRSKAQKVSAGAARTAIFAADNRSTGVGVVGKLYVFNYEAKHDGILPMWDKYPLVLILEKKTDGFIGLNLHYLPRGQRGTLLYVFNKYKEKYQMQKGIVTGGHTNWDNLISSAGTQQLQSYPKRTIKRYLFSHVRSKLIEIYPEEYDKAVQLKIDEWVLKG